MNKNLERHFSQLRYIITDYNFNIYTYNRKHETLNKKHLEVHYLDDSVMTLNIIILMHFIENSHHCIV